MAVRKKGGAARAKAARARVVSPESSSHGSSSLSPVQSAHSELSHDGDEAAEQQPAPPAEADEDQDEDTEMGVADEEAEDDGEDVEGAGEAEGDDGEEDEEDDGDDEEGDGNDEEEEDEENEEEDDDSDDDDDEDEKDEEEGDDEEAVDGKAKPAEQAVDEPETAQDSDQEESRFRYPEAVPDFNALSKREQAFKAARFLKCQQDDCDCAGLEPPGAGTVRQVTRLEAEQATEDNADGLENEQRTKEGWWKFCGACSHGWEDEGHVWAEGVDAGERLRRGRVMGRIEELLQDEDQLCTFPTPHLDSTESLFRQLEHFRRPSGGKSTVPGLPPAIDMSTPGGSATDAADTPIEGDAGEDDGPPRKKARPNGRDTGAAGDDDGAEGGDEGGEGVGGKSRHGKKPAAGGKVPRTIVRGSRGLIPMETEADGSQHVEGQPPAGTQASSGDKGAEGDDTAGPSRTGGAAAAAGDEDEEEDVPLAQQRPQLEESERKRREMIKEKEKEREAEVLRGLANDEGQPVSRDIDIWEGVELPKLPMRPAAIEQANNEIMLPVVGSRNPTPVATILLIGLKNLFQKQLPKMPREYITRLVLDKNHLSMAIVKRGWKVVGGICYRPFESRGFAEIVFCAVDSSEQIKGYGSHLMNSIKDHVRAAHPTINHFLTYADNYAVGYFKKQGFTKEITLPREKWVGYIKDYEGGTIMQCTMVPRVRYLEVHQMLADQKAAILAKIKSLTKSHIVRPGLEVFKDRKPGQQITLSKADVPGLAESGWNPDLDAIMRQPKRNPHHGMLQLVLNDLQNEPSAWPFTKPVDDNVVIDYYEVIKQPMDLSTMETKLENNHYEGIEDFLADARLIFANCRQYNGEKNTYTTQANKLEKALERIMKKRQESTVV